VKAARFGDGAYEACRQVLVVGDVACNNDRPCSKGLYLLCDQAGACGMEVVDEQCGATVRGEVERGLSTDALSGSGDEGDAPFETEDVPHGVLAG
jgi:hypothetical protein